MDKLRVASCQFPVTHDIARNARYIDRYLARAADQGAHLLHTSEACLSGYAGVDFGTYEQFDWDTLRRHTDHLRQRTAELGLWLVLGSSHFLDTHINPTNCLYLIDPTGAIIDRYDKCMCTPGDQRVYSAGQHLVTHNIQGVEIGLAICYDICFPQLYAAYREQGASLMIHSFYNASGQGETCLDVLNRRQVPTRCADNQMWAVANNSSNPYSHWGSFVARPDATIAQQLPKNRAGMLIHDFPDGLSPQGWLHNHMPMKLAPDEILFLGEPSSHPRQLDGRAEP
ncbi:MAG: carbon-nitrogen hydrolase family protein [Candidatus Latescibacteria bacterium]|nr:carbon-nitrogen hydrolase family protein [Candidatus Latescibacterota bacterium]